MLPRLLVFIICTTLSFNAQASDWTRSEDGNYYIPQFSSLGTGDLINFKVHITDANPYATTGVFFKNGQFNPNQNTMTARTSSGIPVDVQFDAQNFYPNGSVRFGLVTIEKPKNIDNQFEVILASDFKKSSKTTITPLKPDVMVVVNRPDFGEKTVYLKQARCENLPWRSGSLIDVRRYYAPLNPDLMVEFDITTFKNGMVRSDIVMRYDRLYETPMRSTNYDMTILVNGKTYKNYPKLRQNHHSKFRIPIRFGFKTDNITALNIPQIIDTRALARYDITLGIDQHRIHNQYEQAKQANNTINGNGLVNPSFPDTGGREDIGLLPEWTARYVMTLHHQARDTVLMQGEIASYIPWHFIDAKTNYYPLPEQHPSLWLDDRATIEDNKITPFTTTDTNWTIDVAHQPSLSYIPYLITGDRYFYDNLVAAYSWSRFSIANNWGILRDPMLRTQNYEQQRAYAWLQRLTAETALVTPTQSPLYKHLKKQMTADVNYFQKGHIEGLEYDDGRYGNPTGELYGSLHGYGDDTGRENPVFMQNLAAIGIGFHANSGVNDSMRTISAFQTNFISGIFLQKHNGYPPEYGAIYKLMQYIPDENGIETKSGKIKILNRWRDVFAYSTKTGYFNETTADIKSVGLSGYAEAGNSFTAYSRAAQAMLYNTTKDEQALEAYGFLAQYIPYAIDDYHKNPAYSIVPEIGHGYLTYKRTFVGDDIDNTMRADTNYSLLHGRNGDDRLSLGDFSGVILGGEGNDLLTAGKQNSFLFGGDGNDILVSNSQDDYLKGDENNGKSADIFVFTQQKFGNDIIADFTPDIDKIKFTPETGTLTFYDDNKLYGSHVDLKDNPNIYRKIISPDIDKNLPPVKRREEIDKLLAAAARGDIEAKNKLNIQSKINVGIENYLRPDGNGGTYIDFNKNRTPEENEKTKNNPTTDYYGIIHLINVPMNKLKPSDFIFSE